MNYYNEIDVKKAAWLRELIRQNVVAPGIVDERSIDDVQPADLDGFVQCHFFAGIGIWSYALRLAGWGDGERVWTGSCPCQPFSAAGKRKGKADERHLWPAWFRLMRERRPGVVFGEQVASGDGLAWLDDVRSDLEAEDYACGAVDLCSAGFGSPHIRQRLYFVGHSDGGQRKFVAGRRAGSGKTESWKPYGESARSGDAGCVANAELPDRWPGAVGRNDGDATQAGRHEGTSGPGERSAVEFVGNSDEEGSQGRRVGRNGSGECAARQASVAGPVNGFWRDAEWVWCRDEKWRPVEPGTQPLASGTPARILRLRGYGDGIVAPQAAAFIRAYREFAA